MIVGMSGSMKDALEKSGLTEPTPAAPKPQQNEKKNEWANELPEDHPPHVPFDAPALIKPKSAPPKR